MKLEGFHLPNTTDNSDVSRRPSAPFQFSILTLLLFTFAFACALSVLFVLPPYFAIPVIIALTVGFPAVLTVSAVYGDRVVRAFCIGALFPTGLLLYITGWTFGLAFTEGPFLEELQTLPQWLEYLETMDSPYRVYAGSAWILSFLVGVSCVLTRAALVRSARRSE